MKVMYEESEEHKQVPSLDNLDTVNVSMSDIDKVSSIDGNPEGEQNIVLDQTCHFGRDTPCKNTCNENEQYCIDHKCLLKTCKNYKYIEDSFCKSHKCSTESCDNPKAIKLSHCPEHLCTVGKCMRGVFPNTSYCDLHICHTNNCAERRTKGNYCPTHSCKEHKCKNEHCETSLYCYSHKCFIDGCINGSKHGSDYCSVHKCHKSSCVEQAMDGCKYCVKCKCHKNGCKLESKASYSQDSTVMWWVNSSFCDDHKCLHKVQERQLWFRCPERPEKGEKYCIKHLCQYKTNDEDKCSSPVTIVERGWGFGTTQACASHTCDVSRCTYVKVGSSNYCKDHKCKYCDRSAWMNDVCLRHIFSHAS